MSDKSTDDMSRAELVKLVEGQDFLLDQARQLLDSLVSEWADLPDGERLSRLRRCAGPLLINPWPLDAKTLAGLRAFDRGNRST